MISPLSQVVALGRGRLSRVLWSLVYRLPDDWSDRAFDFARWWKCGDCFRRFGRHRCWCEPGCSAELSYFYASRAEREYCARFIERYDASAEPWEIAAALRAHGIFDHGEQ